MLNDISIQHLPTNDTRGARLPSEASPTRARVTVVVPVYGDLQSLTSCVEALFTTADPARHDVLLVNDCGPDADEIEQTLLGLIDGHPTFRYERNDRNLGFVGTCNRAVEELDMSDNDVLLLNSDTEPRAGFIEELQAVLYADDRHGVACARSNNATIASLPYRLTGRDTPRTVERTEAVFAELNSALPRWSVSPVAMGFCFLIRRSLIREFGLFDEIFAPGYGEENDFCLRIDKAGYRSVIANRALVIHEGSKSFVGERRNALRDAHQKILEARWPFFARATRAFMRFGIGALERFADPIVPGQSRVSIGVDIRGLSSVLPDSDARHQTVARVRALVLDLGKKADVEVLADPADLVGLRLNPARVRQSSEVTSDEVLHLGLLLSGGLDTTQLAVANRRYAFWASWHVVEKDATRAWDTRVTNLGRDLSSDYLERFSVARIVPATTPDSASLIGLIDSQHRRPLDERRAVLEARWDAFRLVESIPTASAGVDARVRRLQSELNALRDSLSYRIGSRAVSAAKRIARR